MTKSELTSYGQFGFSLEFHSRYQSILFFLDYLLAQSNMSKRSLLVCFCLISLSFPLGLISSMSDIYIDVTSLIQINTHSLLEFFYRLGLNYWNGEDGMTIVAVCGRVGMVVWEFLRTSMVKKRDHIGYNKIITKDVPSSVFDYYFDFI